MKKGQAQNLLAVFGVLSVILLNTCGLLLDDGEVMPQAVIPSSPSDLAATVESLESIALSWETVANADSYKIYRAQSDADLYRPVVIVPGTNYTDESLESSTEYYYKVASIKDGIEGAKSPHASAKTAPPSVPEGIVVRSSASAITISWNKVSGAVLYKVYRAESSGGTYSLVSGDSIGLLFSDTDISSETDYFYKISAVNGIGEGEQTEAIPVSTKIPAAPANLQTATLSTTSIQVLWDAVYGAETYNVYWSNLSSETYTLLGNANENSFVHNGVNRNSMYFYKVSAVNVFGESAHSDFILGEIKIPDAPKNVKAEALSENSIKLTWDPVPGVEQYAIYRDGSQLTTTTGLSYIHNGLSPNRRYSYQVAAINIIGTGGKSTAVSVYTQPRLLKEGEWENVPITGGYGYGEYGYYSFPANGGDYYIQWGDGKGNESPSTRVSAYWSAVNSRENLSSGQPYFSGYLTPQKITVPSSGYIIIWLSGNAYWSFAIRYYR